MVHDAGAFYFFQTETFMKTGVLIAERTGSIELSRLQAVDIDTMDDFELARALHARQQVDRK